MVTQVVPQDPEADLDLLIGGSPGLGNAVAVYDLQPDGLVFDSPVTLTVTADVTDLNANQRERLGVYRWDEYEGKWVLLETADCTVVEDPPGTFIKICTVELDSFSTYAVVAPVDSDDDGIPDLFGDEIDHCPDLPPVDASLAYTGDMLAAIDDSGCAAATLRGRLTDDAGVGLCGVSVEFTVTDGHGVVVCQEVEPTDSSGYAQCGVTGLEPDVYTIAAVSGAVGCPQASDQALLVVFDPNVPRATGGGFILPDGDSSQPAESNQDKAHFGFIVRIDRNRAAAGNLEFQYKSAGINLKSRNMDWYTVSNNKAMFKGTGTINGEGLYTFRVHATDGDLTGDQPDAFDIRIWQGMDTESNPYRAKNDLAGGSIVIHRR